MSIELFFIQTFISEFTYYIKKSNEYCWVIAQKEQRAACIDSYNLGICFQDEDKAIVLEDSFIDSEGHSIRQLNVV